MHYAAADQYVKSGAVKYALVVGSDVLARTCDQQIVGLLLFWRWRGRCGAGCL